MTKIKHRMLVVEDDLATQTQIRNYYEARGYAISCFTRGQMALQSVDWSGEKPFDVILTDYQLPDMTGFEFTAKLISLGNTAPVILMTVHASADLALKAADLGIYDFVVKPLHFQQLTLILEKSHNDKNQTTAEPELEVDKDDEREPIVIGESPSFKSTLYIAKKVAFSRATVLITGESGTGKEVLAKLIHSLSDRRKQKFVAINCSAIPETLLESELFGHAKGAFTGALDKKIGLFEEADRGTLFLDEIGDLPFSLQAKLLRILQERTVRRVGENQDRPIDVRIIAATHKNLVEEVRNKNFREDLFFRLNVIPLNIAPLRERKEDILPLAHHFLKKMAQRNNLNAPSFSQDAIEKLLNLSWRGNIRELENSIERAIILSKNNQITAHELHDSSEYMDFKSPLADPAPAAQEKKFQMHLRDEGYPTLKELELQYIEYVLKEMGGVREKAAQVLDIDRKTLYRRVQELQSNGLKAVH